jgi:uncharacterized protein (TIGR01244 family)
MFTRLSHDFSVAGQLPASAMMEAAIQGYRVVINNRPDDEEPGQPSSSAIAEAAANAGLMYLHIPMGASGLSREMIEATRRAIETATGPVLGFCRSGNRSTILWALARAASGDAPDELMATAAGAGYDLRPVAQLMHDLFNAGSDARR